MHRHLLVLATIMMAAPLGAQGRGPVGLRAPTASPVDPRWASSSAAASLPESEWKKGMIIGGAIGAAFILLVALSFRGEGGNHPGPLAYLAVSVVAALPFAVVGGLIGSMFPGN